MPTKWRLKRPWLVDGSTGPIATVYPQDAICITDGIFLICGRHCETLDPSKFPDWFEKVESPKVLVIEIPWDRSVIPEAITLRRGLDLHTHTQNFKARIEEREE